MKNVLLLVLVTALLTSGLLAGCGGVLTGSEEIKTEEYTFRDFTGIEISSAFEFEITQSDSYGVSITADDSVIDKVEVTTEGNTLKIGLTTIPSRGPVTLKAAVTMPQLSSLVVSGASHGTVSDFSSTENLNLDVSGASKVAGDITAGDADFEVSGASTVQLEGSANNIVANVSGASRFNLGGFTVNNANVTFSDASNGTLNLSDKLDANLSGASTLSYFGQPSLGTMNINGASTLKWLQSAN